MKTILKTVINQTFSAKLCRGCIVHQRCRRYLDRRCLQWSYIVNQHASAIYKFDALATLQAGQGRGRLPA